jgi:hypothetical protein
VALSSTGELHNIKVMAHVSLNELAFGDIRPVFAGLKYVETTPVRVRFQVLTAASMKFRFVFWDILPCKIIVDRRLRNVLLPSSGQHVPLKRR